MRAYCKFPYDSDSGLGSVKIIWNGGELSEEIIITYMHKRFSFNYIIYL